MASQGIISGSKNGSKITKRVVSTIKEMDKSKMENKKPYFIVNPAASGGKAGKRWPGIKRQLMTEGLAFDYQLTGRPGDATVLSQEALKKGYNVIVAVGGDGTLNEVANGFFQVDENTRNKAALGLVPEGTGGDFARLMNISRDIKACAGRIVRGEVCRIDVAYASFHSSGLDSASETSNRYFFNTADVGLGGATIALTHRLRKLLGGFLSYFAAMVFSMVFYRNREITAVIDDNVTWTGKMVTLVVANGQYFGGGMKITPLALPDDGLLDILLIADVSKPRLLVNAHRVYKGAHLDIKGVQLFRGRKISIQTSNNNVLFQLDGEQPGKAPVEIRILPGALRFII